MSFLISVIIAYLLGSLSFAIIVSKFKKFSDPRATGSGNAGATNMLRMVGKQTALYVLLGDILKGLFSVLIARFLNIQGMSLAFVGLVAVLGHLFPVYFKFRGGKGVATMMGVLLGLSLWIGLFVIITWIIIGYLFRYASVAALVSIISAPIYTMIGGRVDYVFPVLLIGVLAIWKHWNNFQRLWQGIEKKIKF